MAWVYLLIAGACEIGWALLLKESQGLTRLLPSALMVALMIASFVFLALAVRQLPIGTAYAIWTGIGAVGVAIVGILAFGEPRDPLRVASIAMVVAGVIGLRLTAG